MKGSEHGARKCIYFVFINRWRQCRRLYNYEERFTSRLVKFESAALKLSVWNPILGNQSRRYVENPSALLLVLIYFSLFRVFYLRLMEAQWTARKRYEFEIHFRCFDSLKNWWNHRIRCEKRSGLLHIRHTRLWTFGARMSAKLCSIFKPNPKISCIYVCLILRKLADELALWFQLAYVQSQVMKSIILYKLVFRLTHLIVNLCTCIHKIFINVTHSIFFSLFIPFENKLTKYIQDLPRGSRFDIWVDLY